MAAMNDLIAVRLFMVKKRNRRENPLGYALLGQRDVGGGRCVLGATARRMFPPVPFDKSPLLHRMMCRNSLLIF
jgi:hypothetical protein